MQRDQQTRVGIVGAGIRGTLFARALMQESSAAVTAICDASIDAREHAARRFEIPTYAGHRDMFEREQLDAVIVATPDFAHAEPAIDAAAARLHMMIEKPLATKLDDAFRIQQAVEAAGVRCMIGFENRWNPRFLTAQRLVRQGDLGEILTQVAHLHDTRFVPTRMLTWAGKSSPAYFLMPHTLDLVLWLAGADVSSVYATGVKRELMGSGVDTWDSIDALLRLSDGSTASLHSAWVLPETYPSVYDLRLEVTGTQSALRVDGSDHGVHYSDERGYRYEQHGTYAVNGGVSGFPIDMVTGFVRWLRTGLGDVPGVVDGLRVTRVIEAIHISLETSAPIDLAAGSSRSLGSH
jgi:predicted dehydrogenase